MPLTGTYLRTLDDKRRLSVPKRLREDFGEADLPHLFLAPGTDRSLLLYAPRAFRSLAGRFQHLVHQQNYLRLFYSSAERLDLDRQGRIRIPDRLAEYAELKSEAVLLGVQDHAELWDRRIWEEFAARWTPNFDQLAHAAFQSLSGDIRAHSE
jgi:MraZ protein